MLPDKLAFVDIETTGLSSPYDRIIEIGIVRVEENKLVQTYHSLINPQTRLPKEITTLTGITADHLENAPTFRSIKKDILEALIDCTFVAHNVRFDYGFIKNEFKREDITFSSKQLCTVKLSRFLYPEQRKHNLDAVIERFQIQCANRHRALDDAKVIFDFYQKLQQLFPTATLEEAINKCFKKPSLPLKLDSSYLEAIPEKPGVYIFYDGQNMPLYVGKSKNIKERVQSHFSSDIHSATEMNIAQQIERIETLPTAGELGALFLESRLIKQLLPVYNKKSRIKRELIALRKTTNKDGYYTVQMETFQQKIHNPVIARISQLAETKQSPEFHRDRHAPNVARDDELNSLLGFFKSRKQAKTFLADIAKRYSLCEKLLGLESASWRTNSSCFAYRLERCKGACIGQELPLTYNLKCVTAFSDTKILPWPFQKAIVIEESEINGTQEFFLVDTWCYLGNIIVDAEGNKKITLDKGTIFDLDLYQILKQQLKNPTLRRRIKEISREEISLLFSEEN